MLFLEGKTLLRCILKKLQVIYQKPCSNSTLYWGEGEVEKGKMLKFGKVFLMFWQALNIHYCICSCEKSEKFVRMINKRSHEICIAIDPNEFSIHTSRPMYEAPKLYDGKYLFTLLIENKLDDFDIFAPIFKEAHTVHDGISSLDCFLHHQ